jgi:dodecin
MSSKLETKSVRANSLHEHRTAKVIEIVATSNRSFEEAVRHGLADASATTRGITGAHVQNLSVRCDDGRIIEYKVDLKIAFGIERTKHP